MPRPSNIAYQTDFIFHRHDGIVEEHADYWVVRTPENPTFWFGNFILFKNAPRDDETVSRWLKIHETAFRGSLNHRIFGWDQELEGELAPFFAQGFKTSHGMALTMRQSPQTCSINSELTVRPIRTDQEWDDVHQQQILVDRVDFGHPEDGGVFRGNQIASYRSLSAANRGNWWGAYRGNKLLGNMGLFFDEENKVGRFQNVSTHPNHRRERICTTLLHHIVDHAFTKMKAQELVICTGAEDDNPAIPTYQNFGFELTSRNYAVKRLPETNAS